MCLTRASRLCVEATDASILAAVLGCSHATRGRTLMSSCRRFPGFPASMSGGRSTPMAPSGRGAACRHTFLTNRHSVGTMGAHPVTARRAPSVHGRRSVRRGGRHPVPPEERLAASGTELAGARRRRARHRRTAQRDPGGGRGQDTALARGTPRTGLPGAAGTHQPWGDGVRPPQSTAEATQRPVRCDPRRPVTTPLPGHPSDGRVRSPGSSKRDIWEYAMELNDRRWMVVTPDERTARRCSRVA